MNTKNDENIKKMWEDIRKNHEIEGFLKFYHKFRIRIVSVLKDPPNNQEEFNKAINYVEDGLLKTLFFLKAALTKPDNNSLEYLVSVLDDLINVKKTNKKSND